MKISLTIPDSLFEHYVQKYGIPGCYTRIRQGMELLKDVPANDRVLFIDPDRRRALEAVFQIPIADAEHLVKETEKMNRVRIGDVQITFDHGELARMKEQAGFHGRTFEVFATEMATEIKDRMLEKI